MPAASASARTTRRAGEGILARSIAQTLRELKAVGNHAVRGASSDVDSMGAAFRSVRRDCGGASDADERNVRLRQFDGAAVCLPRHRLGSLYRYDLARPFIEKVRERSFGIGNKYLQ